jgi:hypothetical protein
MAKRSIPDVPYEPGPWRFTKSRLSNLSFAFYLPNQPDTLLPPQLVIPARKLSPKSKIFLLGYATALHWKNNNEGILVEIPVDAVKKLHHQPAYTFKW